MAETCQCSGHGETRLLPRSCVCSRWFWSAHSRNQPKPSSSNRVAFAFRGAVVSCGDTLMTRSSHIPQGNSCSRMALQNERGPRCVCGGVSSVCCKRRVLVLAGVWARWAMTDRSIHSLRISTPTELLDDLRMGCGTARVPGRSPVAFGWPTPLIPCHGPLIPACACGHVKRSTSASYCYCSVLPPAFGGLIEWGVSQTYALVCNNTYRTVLVAVATDSRTRATRRAMRRQESMTVGGFWAASDNKWVGD